MFRDCYFEYAGQYSGDYNLVMMYVENSYDKFDSGGQYEVATDVLPASEAWAHRQTAYLPLSF